MRRSALILGCGYTGQRVARFLLARGWRVTATTRSPERLADLGKRGAEVLRFEALEDARWHLPASGASVLLSIPTVNHDGALSEPTARALAALAGRPRQVVYLSTTGVYGATRNVDETTPAAPATERQRLRVAAEQAVRECSSPSLVLRPAAIYGPHRGVHAAMRAGRFKLAQGDRERYVSRIHVDDLALIVGMAMERGLEGVYPVADEEPAPSSEIARFCSELLGLTIPACVPSARLSETRRSDRRVDGTAVLRRLGLELRFPTYREGIRASLAAESGR